MRRCEALLSIINNCPGVSMTRELGTGYTCCRAMCGVILHGNMDDFVFAEHGRRASFPVYAARQGSKSGSLAGSSNTNNITY